MKLVRIIDSEGYYLREGIVEEESEFAIVATCPSGFILPRWDGTQWVEGGTPPAPVAQPPSAEERIAALESAILVLLKGGV